ncbi:MAG: hypothetical protein B7Z80_15860 [Rhodospirillales bacterium 20-64-7]|nr:MAG: hypothetical protein B7Z80_15860 [Rhodospirillales bacterium 20-64-7]
MSSTAAPDAGIMHRPGASTGDVHTLEVAYLKARIQHLELVLETARGLMGSNHERLLRRLHDVPGELAELGVQLRRLDPKRVL